MCALLQSKHANKVQVIHHFMARNAEKMSNCSKGLITVNPVMDLPKATLGCFSLLLLKIWENKFSINVLVYTLIIRSCY